MGGKDFSLQQCSWVDFFIFSLKVIILLFYSILHVLYYMYVKNNISKWWIYHRVTVKFCFFKDFDRFWCKSMFFTYVASFPWILMMIFGFYVINNPYTNIKIIHINDRFSRYFSRLLCFFSRKSQNGPKLLFSYSFHHFHHFHISYSHSTPSITYIPTLISYMLMKIVWLYWVGLCVFTMEEFCKGN